MDMEQLGKVGKELKACPYYGTRYAVPNAQVCDNIFLPRVITSTLHL